MTLYSRSTVACLFLCMGAANPGTAQESPADAAEPGGDQQGFASQFKDPEGGWFDMSQFLLKKATGIMPVPIIITEPTVDNGLGLTGILVDIILPQALI
jgi:hypothetical protein